jgi:branched-chain amino acid aminotransferase
MLGDYVYIDGRVVPKDAAVVSVFDHGFLYGDGVFEGVSVVNRAVFKLGDHLRRLNDSARYLAIDCPDESVIREAVFQTARKNELDEGYLRIVLSRGAGPVGIRNMDKLGKPTLVVIAQHERRAARAAVYEKGLSAMICSVRRTPPECVDGKAKTCNYINNILAFLEARAASADTAILLDTSGNVAEGYAANTFIVSKGIVKTPTLGSILNGITRQTVIGLCGKAGIVCVETTLTPHDLATADEVFETGSLAEIKPIVSIGGRTIGSGNPGPMTKQLHEALRALMDSKVASESF